MKASICMITYNQSNVLGKAIEGVLIQDVDFDYELIITNDGSPDDTDSVVQNFIDSHPKGNKIRYFNHKKNIGANLNFIFALEKCNGKFIAICEGDDYWTDNLKLKKQVDFLEKNPDYGLIHSDCNLFYEETGTMIPNGNSDLKYLSRIKQENIPTSLITFRYRIRTATALFSNELFQQFKEEYFREAVGFKMMDIPLWIELALRAKVRYMNEVTTVYRINMGSLSNVKSREKQTYFYLSMYDMRLFYINKYNIGSSLLKNNIKIRYRLILQKYNCVVENKGKLKYVLLKILEKIINRVESLYFLLKEKIRYSGTP